MTNFRPESASMYGRTFRPGISTNPASESAGKAPAAPPVAGLPDSARTPMQWSAENTPVFHSQRPWFYLESNYTESKRRLSGSDPVLFSTSTALPEAGKSLPVCSTA